MRSWLSLMPCSLSQPLICSGDQRIWRNFASILLRVGTVSLRAYSVSPVVLSLRFSLLEPIAALTPITAHLSAHRALTDAQNAGDVFLAGGYPLSRCSIMRSIVESAE